ncbi:MAG: hypothetical protein J6C62_08235 [Clostridia bacterium]|nr:hypothetical protein [Clostridia bacterium]
MDENEKFKSKMKEIYNSNTNNFDGLEKIKQAVELERMFSDVNFENVINEIDVSEDDKFGFLLKETINKEL